MSDSKQTSSDLSNSVVDLPEPVSPPADPCDEVGASDIQLGATWNPDRKQTGFAVYAPIASRVDVCLFDASKDAGTAPPDISRQLIRGDGSVWTGVVNGCAAPGTPYGFRLFGEGYPAEGELVLDPYARAYTGSSDWHPALMAGTRAPGTVPTILGVVVDESFDWGDDQPLKLPWSELVIYETHVKGQTQLLEDVPEDLRGTYAGMANEATISRLKEIGVTAVELLPVHQHLNDGFLIERGLTNYWGYNTVGFFAPHNEWSSSARPAEAIREFKGMVKALHKAGIEVILDVVYNHTAEGGQGGPTINFRGLDDLGYYKKPIDPLAYWDCTGCGNTFDVDHPRGLQVVLDSLRYWVREMHVDGFRFDLAATLAREPFEYRIKSAFFKAIAQDPELRATKLIAEPWDVGQADSYQLGNFPVGWSELNGRYRDIVRRYWRGDGGLAGEFAGRLTGSQRIFGPSGRGPRSSVNFVTCHDGFTLRDLVSYTEKANSANNEDNRDGTGNNHSANYGEEGATNDSEILAIRRRQQRNFLATVMLSSGVPFLTAGDERNRTQGGNNNAYCQDGPISWLDWSSSPDADDLVSFTASLSRFRRENPCFNRNQYFSGAQDAETGVRDILWISPECYPMCHDTWHAESTRAFGAIFDRAPEPSLISDPADNKKAGLLLLILNPESEPVTFVMPGKKGNRWRAVLDTAADDAFQIDGEEIAGGGNVALVGRSLQILELVAGASAKGQTTRRPKKARRSASKAATKKDETKD